MQLETRKRIKTSEVLVNWDTRARKNYNFTELKASIEAHGLMHPIVVYSKDGSAPYTLVAGASRLQACEELGWTEIDCSIYDAPLDELELALLERDENSARTDLTFVEKAAEHVRLHQLHIAKHGRKIARSASAPGWTMQDTAKVLRISSDTLSTDLKLLAGIAKYPKLELEKEPSKLAALRKLDAETDHSVPAKQKLMERKVESATAAREASLDALMNEVAAKPRVERKVTKASSDAEPTYITEQRNAVANLDDISRRSALSTAEHEEFKEAVEATELPSNVKASLKSHSASCSLEMLSNMIIEFSRRR